jgi:hypothetical protein
MKADAAFEQKVIKIISGKLPLQNTNLEERWITKRFRHVSIYFTLALLYIISHTAVTRSPQKHLASLFRHQHSIQHSDFVSTWTNITQQNCELNIHQRNEIFISWGRFRRRWEDNIKMDLPEVGCGVWTGLSWLRIETGSGQLWMR